MNTKVLTFKREKKYGFYRQLLLSCNLFIVSQDYVYCWYACMEHHIEPFEVNSYMFYSSFAYDFSFVSVSHILKSA